jgi:hypothetical protein
LQLFADWNLASHFVKEVFEEGHLALRLLSLRCLEWHERDDPFAVGREIDVLSDACYLERAPLSIRREGPRNQN